MKSETYMDGKEFWNRLRDIMDEHGDNLNKLAKRADIPYNTLYNKSCFGKLPTDGQLQKMAGALGMVAGDLRRGNFEEYVSITKTEEKIEEEAAMEEMPEDIDTRDVQAESVGVDACYDGTERLWALEKVHFIVGTVTDTEMAIKKLTALRKAIDVTIYYLEDK